MPIVLSLGSGAGLCAGKATSSIMALGLPRRLPTWLWSPQLRRSVSTTSSSSSSHLEAWLKKHGVFDAAQAQKWREFDHGWNYPIFDFTGKRVALTGLRRWLQGPPETLPHYQWVPCTSHPPISPSSLPRYYLPSGSPLSDAVAHSLGDVYAVEGELALLALLAAGRRNAVAWFSQGRQGAPQGQAQLLPKSLAEDCARWSARRIRLFTTARDKAADEVQRAVAALSSGGAAIDWVVLQLPPPSPPPPPSFLSSSRCDDPITSLWVASSFNPHAFLQRLHSCPTLATSSRIRAITYSQQQTLLYRDCDCTYGAGPAGRDEGEAGGGAPPRRAAPPPQQQRGTEAARKRPPEAGGVLEPQAGRAAVLPHKCARQWLLPEVIEIDLLDKRDAAATTITTTNTVNTVARC